MVRLSAVHKQHFDAAAPAVLDGVSLQVAAGETFGLCGPGAGGKSVLLKILCGLIDPEEGSAEVAGHPVAPDGPGRARAQAQIGMLFQNNALFDSFTVAENVAFPVRQRARRDPEFQIDERELQAQVQARLRAVGLGDHGHKMPSQLSGGQRKRAALARVVMSRPRLIIYDEPTAGLDPVTTAKIYDLLRRERDETGATVIIVSSDVDALRAFAPRMGMLYKGRLRYDGPAATMQECDDPVVRQFVRGETEGPL